MKFNVFDIVVVWKGIHFEYLFFYYFRLLFYPNQMLAAMVMSQHQFLSAKTVRPCAPRDVQCMKYVNRAWYVVCLIAPHWQFNKGARLHLCMDKWNRPTPVCRQMRLTQAVRGKFIPTGMALVMGMKIQKPGCILRILGVPSIFCPLERADA